MLKLKGLIKLDGISKAAIALPSQDELIADKTQVMVSGWGYTRNAAESNLKLRGVVILTKNQAQCNNTYKSDGGITIRMVCAASPGKDSCNGDSGTVNSKSASVQFNMQNNFTKNSGGPMRSLTNNKLIGIVSFGMACADPTFPGVYSRVATARTWIKSISGV